MTYSCLFVRPPSLPISEWSRMLHLNKAPVLKASLTQAQGHAKPADPDDAELRVALHQTPLDFRGHLAIGQHLRSLIKQVLYCTFVHGTGGSAALETNILYKIGLKITKYMDGN